MAKLPMSQQQLQQAHLQSPMILIHSPRVNRLHDTVPYKVAAIKVITNKRPPSVQNPTQQEEPEDPTIKQAEEEEDQLIERVETTTIPANVQGRWTNEEVELVMAHPNLTHAEAYSRYLTTCKQMGLVN